MLKTYVIILLVLCPSVPLILNTDNEIIATESQSHTKPYIESFLRQDLESYQSSMGAGSSTKAAMLQFENELDASELAFAESVGIRFRTRGQHLVHVGSTYLCDVNNINALGALSDIGLKRATSGGKKFHSSIESSVPAIDAPAVWNNLKKDGEMINGSGATVAVIDTGATWLHPTFWRVTEMDVVVLEDNGAFYADLNENGVPDDGEGPLKQSDGQAPSTIDVSNEYLFIDAEDNDQFSYDEGDRWLAGIDSNDDGILTLPEENVALLGESKVKTFYDQTENQVYARGVNLTSEALPGGDNNGHGTHVASTIAGGQIGLTSMVGVAPGVDLVIIKSPLTSASILDAIHFAILHEADIINMSFSSYLGFLDGTDLEDLAATDAFLQNDTLCTAAAGNLGGRSKHSRFNVPSGGDAGTTLSVSNPPDYSFLNMIWYSSDQDESVILSPPYGGEDVTLGPIDEMVGSVYSVKTNDIHAYAFVDVNSRGFNRLIVQISESNHNWTSGTWTVTLENPSGDSVTVDAYAWDHDWSGGSLRFTSRLDNSHTISSPATGDFALAVSSYSETSGKITSQSSRGPRIDETPKPEISAPGVSIEAASAFTSTSDSLWTTRTGTSMATPHIAGALALSYQSSDESTLWDDLSALLEGAGGISSHHSPPEVDWGFGLCDTLHTVRHVLDVPLTSGTTLSDWTGIEPIVTSDENLSLYGELDIVSVSAYRDQNQVGMAATVRETPTSWNSYNFSLALDVDDDNATGFDGADLMVNVTDGTIQAYYWDGSWVESDEDKAEWWTSSTTLFVRVDTGVMADRIMMNMYTHNSTLSPADSLDDVTLENTWRPLFQEIKFDANNGIYSLNISITDRDSLSTSIDLGWKLVYGRDSIVETDTLAGSKNYLLAFNSSSWDTTYSMSAILNISDGYETLYLNSLMIERTISGALGIASASLDNTTVRVGPFIQDMITGRIEIEGYLMASSVGVSFVGTTGNPLNFTLSSTDGIYDIRIKPSGLSPGEYDVYAYAISRTGQRIEERFASLQVVEDYTILIIGAVVVGGLAAILVLVSRYFKKE